MQGAKWAGLCLLALLCGAGGSHLGLPAAYLVVPLVVSGAMAVIGLKLKMANLPYVFAQAVSGCLVGSYIEASVLQGMMDFWPVILLSASLTIAMSLSVGGVIGRLCGIDLRLAIWGFMPGMAPLMIAMADERGLDGRMVAVMQVFRLVFVILAVALLGSVMGIPAQSAAPALSHAPGTSGLIGCALVVAAGIFAGYRMTFFPAAAMLVPVLLAGALSTTEVIAIAVPDWLFDIALMIIGLQVGLRVTRELVKAGLKALPHIFGGFTLLLVLCLGLAVAIFSIADVDMMSAILATVPGSTETISIMAVASGLNVSFVITFQTVRLLVLTIIGPFIADWFCLKLTPKES